MKKHTHTKSIFS